ncbi:MAG: hypothetical protein KA004_03980 [Verrucomicrobiales bacterium]|nr:hypothetical protein [Verrucomicrobiales bacterium]
MKLNSLCTTGLLAAAILASPATSLAGTFAIEFHQDAAYMADPFYNDVNSTIFFGTAVDGDLAARMAGYYYDSDPVDPGHNGLMNRGLPWNSEDPDHPIPGWLIRFGLQSDAVGNPVHTYPLPGGGTAQQPASYISFKVDSPDTVLFEEVGVTINNLQGAGPGQQIWAGTSKDNFATGISPTVVMDPNNGLQMSFGWTNFDYLSEGVELRIYGIIGADEGTFDSANLFGRSTPPPVPEPSGASLLGCLLLGMLTRRSRRM